MHLMQVMRVYYFSECVWEINIFFKQVYYFLQYMQLTSFYSKCALYMHNEHS